jgi:hypothetical protein
VSTRFLVTVLVDGTPLFAMLFARPYGLFGRPDAARV